MPRADRRVAPITSIPKDLTPDIFLYYMNTLIEQLNTSFSSLDQLESQLRGEEGYTVSFGSDIDIQGHRVVNLTSLLGDEANNQTKAVPLSDLTTLIDRALAPGIIVLWSGAVADIPAGWALCNGSNGTPDLRERFVVGAGNTYTPGDTGGADSVDLAHTHTGTTGAPSATTTVDATLAGATAAVGSGTHTHTFTSASSLGVTDIRPKYYGLAYIMRLAS